MRNFHGHESYAGMALIVMIIINFLFTVGIKLIIAHILKKSEPIKTNYSTKDSKTIIFTIMGSIIYDCILPHPKF